MPDSEDTLFQTALRQRWSNQPAPNVRSYVGAFFDQTRIGTKIVAKVRGNHGIYTVSLQLEDSLIRAACSCYIGKDGCHHCEALAITFLNDPSAFKEVKQTQRDDLQTLADLQAYLQSTTLETLLKELKVHGITQKAFAASIGMSTQHLSAVRSSELRHHYFHELGATKLACLWVLTHIAQAQTR